MKFIKLAGALGAEVADVRLDQLNGEDLRSLRVGFLEHGVLFVRNQELTSGAFRDFARSMGDPVPYPFVKGLPDYSEIIEVKKLEHETVNFGGVWHSDTIYLPEPPKGTMLIAREVPAFGGDTLFASQYAAYDALSAPMKRMLEGLGAVSSSAKALQCEWTPQADS